MFRSQYDSHARVRQPCGNPIKTLYAPRINDDGTFDLIEKGKHDLYAEIQSHAEGCDIHVLLERFQRGEVDVLSKVQGVYGDFTGMPKTYAEMFQRVEDGKQWFYSLPVEVRAEFNQDFVQFMTAMDKPDFYERITSVMYSNDVPTETVKEVDPVES